MNQPLKWNFYNFYRKGKEAPFKNLALRSSDTKFYSEVGFDFPSIEDIRQMGYFNEGFSAVPLDLMAIYWSGRDDCVYHDSIYAENDDS